MTSLPGIAAPLRARFRTRRVAALAAALLACLAAGGVAGPAHERGETPGTHRDFWTAPDAAAPAQVSADDDAARDWDTLPALASASPALFAPAALRVRRAAARTTRLSETAHRVPPARAPPA